MGVHGVRIGLDVIGDITDVQIPRVERHEIVHVAGFGEVVKAGGIVQAIVERLAGELQFLRDLMLFLTVSHFLERLGVPSRSVPMFQTMPR